VMQSQHYGAVGHALDYVFYRGVAGYLVRPLRPILVLIVLVLLISIGRDLRRARAPEDRTSPPRTRRPSTRAQAHGAGLLTNLLNTLAKLGPRRSKDEPKLSERLEVFAYRLLVVCALLGLANSNPTLRQMVDTLF
jgi:hypothetical protein